MSTSIADRLSERIYSSNSFLSRRRVKRYREDLSNVANLVLGDQLARFGVLMLSVFIFLAIFGPMLAPYDPATVHREDGQVLRTTAPSADHVLGTTNHGEDVLSQIIYSVRVSVGVGIFAALIAVFIGTNAALIGGYFGGWIDDILMRVVDIAYGLPFLPFVIVLVFIFGTNIQNIILVIALILWRDSARVIRSEVLSQKQRPYVESAKAVGASDLRIIYKHIFPNVLPLVGLYTAFAVAYAVIYEASLAFLGYGDPELYSWGQMLFQAYQSGAIRYAWWWIIPAGVSIMLLVSSVFFIGRSLEEITNRELRH
ncbi:MAG: ABC transporter permease [Natronomonas sp.]|uniref:ABC transporter permease n=1 Tax=Natronomonas sp. TaxID=2184060 RepID=UPI00287081CD|nr:ABC transporter permease [Natronomonas sp.]MDR9429396.1 ABC transporter permease [Natronomonas sp.]